MNRIGQKQIAIVVEAIISIIFLSAVIPIIFQLSSLSNPDPKVVVDDAAVQQAKNLSEQLAICQQNFNELNKSVVTKDDLLGLTSAIQQVNQNVITIYERSENYIQNYFSLTIKLTIALTLTFSIGLFTLLDWTIFKFELGKGLIKAVKNRFNKKEEVRQ